MNRSISLRIILFFVFFGLFTVSFYVGSTTELSQEESLAIMFDFQNAMEDADSTSILLNNLSIGLPNFIPGFGPAWGLYSAWSTETAVSGIWSMTPELHGISPLVIFYGSPFGFIELIAYSIGMSRGAFLIFSFVKRHSMKSILKWSAVEVGIVVALLVGGAVMEISMI